MDPIPKVLLENYQDSLFGRSKLNLYRGVAGRHGVFPTSAQKVRYFTELSKQFPALGVLVAEMFTTSKFQRWEIESLTENINPQALSERLVKYPITETLFVELTGDEKPLLVCINAFAYEGNEGKTIHVIFTEELSFPNGVIGNVEFNVAEANISCLTAKGHFTVTMNDWKTLNEPFVDLALSLLDYRLSNYQSPFISLQQAMENNWDLKFTPRNEPPHDPVCAELLSKLYSGEIKLTIATVSFDKVRPYSYEECFELSLLNLDAGLKAVDEAFLLVYEKDGKFIASDDYILYMALRLRELPHMKVAIMGAFKKQDVKVITTGGPELLPDLFQRDKPVSDNLSAELNENVLSAFLVKLRLANNAGEWSGIKCVVLTEDLHNHMLDTLLESSGMHPDEIRVMSFEGCAQVGSLAIIIATLWQIKKDLRFVVHRDSDYLSKHEVMKLSDKIIGYGATPLLTKGTDIESYYLNSEHINYLYHELTIAEIELMLQTATQTAEKESLALFRKQKYKTDYNSTRALNDLQITADYHSDVNRYRYGKRTLGLLKSMLQSKLKNNPDLIKPSPFLYDARVRTLASEIWPNHILPWN